MKISIPAMATAAFIFFSPLGLNAAFAVGALSTTADVKTGDDLVTVCTPLVEQDVSEQGRHSSAICSQFLGDMVAKVSKATAPGMPTEFHRVGPKKDQTACFYLPTKLTFVDFAKLVVAYRQSHPDLGTRPAFELGAWTLATNFPCKSE